MKLLGFICVIIMNWISYKEEKAPSFMRYWGNEFTNKQWI